MTDDDATVIPMGLYYLAAQLLDRDIGASILNLAQETKGRDPDPLVRFIETIKREQPDIIGFSLTNPSRFSAMACAGAARKICPKTLIIFGGPAPTFMADHLFRACPELDIIVQGEGEEAVLELANALKKKEAQIPAILKDIKGLIFRQGNDLVDTGPSELIQDLDELAHPSKYFRFQHLAMSRGCPGKCTFCGSPKFWGTSRVRRHSVDWFFEEIQTLAQNGVSHFFFSDDTFTMDRDQVITLCKKIIDSKLSITWNAISRVDYIDEDLLFMMRRAGCIQISFGVESGADRIKKILGKPMDNDTCVQAFSLARSLGIMPRAYFIYGSPGETQATIKESLGLMERLAPLSIVSYMLVLFPGTHLYTLAQQKNLVNDDIWFQKIEDLPWFELDKALDFDRVKSYGDMLRQGFARKLEHFVTTLDLKDDKRLYSFHADFLSRLAMTFSHGEYAQTPLIKNPESIAESLFKKALTYSHDPRAYLGLAMIHQKNREFPQAMTWLGTGLEHFPENKDLSVGMGVCLMNQGQFKKALSFFTPFDKDPGLGHYINICQTRMNT